VADVNRHFSDIVSGGGKASEETYRFLCGKVFPAKLFAHETVLDVTQRVFEVTGSRGATRQTGLEKLWRDARNHSLHDELRVRYRIVGAGVLELDPA
jgi:alkylation response protein AidB-like acyl-CoA dehydrogenase